MKKFWKVFFVMVMVVALAACGVAPVSEKEVEVKKVEQESEAIHEESEIKQDMASENIIIKTSPDKYTWYIKNYVGKNCASLGYVSMGGDRLDHYGAGVLELVFVTADGTYIDIGSEDALKEYTVIGQSLSPNTELKLVFEKDSEGNEYDSLVATQNYQEIVLNVKKVGAEDEPANLTVINPSPDKYTWYVSDYVGRNLMHCGYISLGGDLMDRYGAAVIKFIIVAEDGSYVDPSDENALKSYVVTAQNVAPNSEMKLVFDKDSSGVEYDNLVESQNIEEIELYVKKLDGVQSDVLMQKEEVTSLEKIVLEETKADTDSEQFVDGMRPEFKEAMDSYEAFYVEYYDMMKKYNNNPTDLSILAEYSELMEKAIEVDEKFAEWDEGEMNDAELKYYLEVTGRISQMAYEVLQ
ncbi:MAG: hypothetical protein E7292_01010 [Lachnospiraceae bacterium]|nr:hypothetical protein [Lachnospiraceae bacterium]